MATKQKQGRPVATFDHLRKKKPVEIVRYMPVDDQAFEAYNEARNDLERAKLVGDVDRVETTLRLVEETRKVAQSPEASIRMVFRAMGRERYKDLVASCPPPKADVEQAKADREAVPEFDAEKLAPLLISATLVEPVMTPDQVAALTLAEDQETADGTPGLGWTEAEYSELFNTSLLVNNTSRITDFSF